MKAGKTASVAALLAILALGGCKNPLYWAWPARKLFVAVPATRKIFELDRSGLRSTWGQIWLDSGATRLAYARKRGVLYALLPEAKGLAEISPDTFAVQYTYGTQGRSTDLAISGDENYAYVLNPEERAVVRMELATRKVLAPMYYADTDFVPVAIAAHPAKPDDLYVVSASGSVSVAQGGTKGAFFITLGNVTRASRIVQGRRNDLYVIDAVGTNLYRITEPDSSKVEAFALNLQGGSAAAGTDGTVYVTAPAANKLVTLTTSQERLSFDVKSQTPRAVVADADGVYIATEGSNQVVAMQIKGGRLTDPQVVDSLPGPPVDMIAVGD